MFLMGYVVLFFIMCSLLYLGNGRSVLLSSLCLEILSASLLFCWLVISSSELFILVVVVIVFSALVVVCSVVKILVSTGIFKARSFIF